MMRMWAEHVGTLYVASQEMQSNTSHLFTKKQFKINVQKLYRKHRKVIKPNKILYTEHVVASSFEDECINRRLPVTTIATIN